MHFNFVFLPVAGRRSYGLCGIGINMQGVMG